MKTLPLPIVKEISFDELTTLLPTDCQIQLRVERPIKVSPANRAIAVEEKQENGEQYTLIA